MKHIWKCNKCSIPGKHPCYVLNNMPTRCPEKTSMKVQADFKQITRKEFVLDLKKMRIIS